MKRYALIDSTNVHTTLGQTGDPWRIDWKKFFVYLRDKYQVQKAVCFLGYHPKHTDIYTKLLSEGYELVHKPMIPTEKGLFKGNCDAEMVLYAVDRQNEYDEAILVTGDGDFYCLAEYLKNKNKLFRVIAPKVESASYLLKGLGPTHFMTLGDIRDKVEYIKKT